MSSEGFFVDWDGNLRSAGDPGGGYLCEIDMGARYVAVTMKNGTLVHEATLFKTAADVEKAGIKAQLVPGSHPWGKKADGF
ncbi:hypothetical protein S58_57070 [Bradyrhizobium oligotrophicum S58]|uniref:Uncharacterized protein n=1 Tax=Bradyrhizobium oligotrophicum S58 TaxID=1245469 RepID=M4ZD59_9BRAD|nr:hypothetical protein [Bradyrhizobium oligotrophicum]BAM91684.1 hypothetical protein S58_57070 [Bradyrhizobium oligotrophicum S58]